MWWGVLFAAVAACLSVATTAAPLVIPAAGAADRSADSSARLHELHTTGASAASREQLGADLRLEPEPGAVPARTAARPARGQPPSLLARAAPQPGGVHALLRMNGVRADLGNVAGDLPYGEAELIADLYRFPLAGSASTVVGPPLAVAPRSAPIIATSPGPVSSRSIAGSALGALSLLILAAMLRRAFGWSPLPAPLPLPRARALPVVRQVARPPARRTPAPRRPARSRRATR